MALKITKESLAEAIASGKPVVVDFWAEWCGPCRMIGPIIEELAAEYEGKVIVGKCDVDQNQELAAQFGVRNIPYVVFLKGGEVVDKQVGAAPKAMLQEKIAKLM